MAIELHQQQEIQIKQGEFETRFGYQINNRREFAMYLTQLFGGIAGNSINYVADIIKAENKGELSDSNTVSENIFTAVIEHPIAESIAEFTYELDWKNVNGEMKLVTDFGTLDDIYDEGVNNKSGQIPKFEQERNIKNRELYNKLKIYRTHGNFNPVVEFSPSPEMSDEAIKRGYKGNDAIFIYEHKNGKEIVTQHWIDRQDFREYQRLLQELQKFSNQIGDTFKDFNNNIINSDLDVMSASGVLNEVQHELLLEFISNKKPDIERYKEIIVEYTQNIIRPKINTEIYPKVKELATLILNGNIEEYKVREKLQELSDNMARFQLELYLLANRSGNDITLDEYVGLSSTDQVKYMAQIAFEMTGCGISESITLSSQIFGKSSGMTVDAVGINENSRVVCKSPACSHYWYVVNGNPKTYKESCPACGENMSC